MIEKLKGYYFLYRLISTKEIKSMEDVYNMIEVVENYARTKKIKRMADWF